MPSNRFEYRCLGNDQGSVYIWSSKGSYIDSWKPHEGMTNSVKINGHWVLSGGDLICVYSIAQKMAYMWGWCESLITDVEWMSRNGIDQYLVAQVSGNICLNVFTEDQQLKQLGKVNNSRVFEIMILTFSKSSIPINLYYSKILKQVFCR